MARRSVVHAASTSDSADAELEEDDDPAAAPPVTGQRIELDLSVVYSPTYLVPMLCLRAWNQRELQTLVTLTDMQMACPSHSPSW
jgi:hypothetical protein